MACKSCNDHHWVVWKIEGMPFVRHCAECNQDGKLDPPEGQKDWLKEKSEASK